MILNSGYHTLKLVGRNSNIYKRTMEKNLLMPSSKAFTKREILLLAISHLIYTKKRKSKIILKNPSHDKKLITH